MHNNKRFALSALAFAVALALVSCKPLQGHAVEIDVGEQTGIFDYLDTAGENLQQIDFSLDSDQDGNRSVRLKIYGLQQLAITQQTSFYDSLDFSAAPDVATISGAGVSGLYIYNDELRSGIISLPGSDRSGSFTFFSSPDMTLTLVPSNMANIWSASSTSGSATWSIGFGVLQPASSISLVSSNTTLQSDFAVTSRVAASVRFRSPATQSTPPTWSPGVFVADGSASLPTQTLIGLGEDLTLPTGEVDSSRPWDYYNEVLLPYMQDEFPGFDDYFIFPDGYQPPVQPSTVPVEYPTLPGFDLALETNGTEPASEYAYDIPDMPTKDIAVPSFDLSSINPAEVMAPVADHLRSMWALVTGVLTEFGLFPYVAIAVFAAIIAGLLHLGK